METFNNQLTDRNKGPLDLCSGMPSNQDERPLDVHPGMLSNKEKEHCAVTTMRRMLEKYSEKKKIPFEQAFFLFTNSNAYKALFDYETGIWSEGPDYLMDFFETVLNVNEK